MKIIFRTFVFFLLFSLKGFSQKDACAPVADPRYGMSYASSPDKEAEFPGGKDSLTDFLSKHALLIHSQNVSTCEASKVSVEFIIKKDGSVTFVNMLKPASCDGLRRYIDEMFSRMPRWTPASCKGKPVASKKSLSFSLKSK